MKTKKSGLPPKWGVEYRKTHPPYLRWIVIGERKLIYPGAYDETTYSFRTKKEAETYAQERILLERNKAEDKGEE